MANRESQCKREMKPVKRNCECASAPLELPLNAAILLVAALRTPAQFSVLPFFVMFSIRLTQVLLTEQNCTI